MRNGTHQLRFPANIAAPVYTWRGGDCSSPKHVCLLCLRCPALAQWPRYTGRGGCHPPNHVCLLRLPCLALYSLLDSGGGGNRERGFQLPLIRAFNISRFGIVQAETRPSRQGQLSAPYRAPAGKICAGLPCLALPCLALPCLALPRLALPCLASPCLALPCLALPCLVLSCLV